MRPIRVFIVDDHPVVREGLRSLLSSESDMTVVGEASSVSEALHGARETSPDVVVLDIKLKDGDGIDVCRKIKAASPTTGVIMLSAFWDDSLIREALQVADGYLLKHAERFDLQDSIRRVARGEHTLDSTLLGAVVSQFRGEQAGGLDPPAVSDQEVRLLQLVAQGLTNREIAARMYLSPHTVKDYLSEVMGKLGAKNRAEAVLLATKRGLL
ncbi:MAG: response regulator transcription factor [Dehalococcoidia bacterium]|nr:response regulator transcription factor [Dehalococcoidia bacterium]